MDTELSRKDRIQIALSRSGQTGHSLSKTLRVNHGTIYRWLIKPPWQQRSIEKYNQMMRIIGLESEMLPDDPEPATIPAAPSDMGAHARIKSALDILGPLSSEIDSASAEYSVFSSAVMQLLKLENSLRKKSR